MRLGLKSLFVYLFLLSLLVSAAAYAQAPEVVSVSPAQADESVSLTTTITAAFDQDLQGVTVTAASFRVFSTLIGEVEGVVSFDSLAREAEFVPDDPFVPGDVITVVLTDAITGINSLALESGYLWRFRTETPEAGGAMRLERSRDVSTGGLSRPRAVAAHDLDGQFGPDIVTANAHNSTVSVLPKTSDSTIGTLVVTAVGLKPEDLAVADFDNDDTLDIALVGTTGVNAYVSILHGNGDGTFGSQASDSSLLPGTPVSVVTGDVDNDGDMDLLTSVPSVDSVWVLKNDGTGQFSVDSSYRVLDAPGGLALGDLDGDGDLDAISTNESSHDIAILINTDGDGTYTISDFVSTQGTTPRAPYVVDLEGDGDLDVVVCNQDSDNIALFRNDGSGTLSHYLELETGDTPTSVVCGDINGDGNMDLVTGHRTSNSVAVFTSRGLPDQKYEFRRDYYVATTGVDGPDDVTLADMSGDGLLDIVTSTGGTGANNGRVATFLNGEFVQATDVSPASNELVSATLSEVSITFDNPMEIIGTEFASWQISVFGSLSGFIADPTIQSSNGNKTFSVQLTESLHAGEQITVSVGEGVLSDISGTGKGFPLAQSYTWSFSVEASDSGDIHVPVHTTNLSAAATSMVVGDLDGDGTADLLTVDSDAKKIIRLLNQGTGLFDTATAVTTVKTPSAIDLGDINNDGALDLVVALREETPTAGEAAVYLNDGTGLFSLDSTYGAGLFPQGISAGDIDGDGFIDISVSNGFGTSVSVFLHLGDTATSDFAPATNYTTGSFPGLLRLMDADGDLDMDLVVAAEAGFEINLLENLGRAQMEHAADIPIDSLPEALSIGDINGDGLSDLVVAGRNDLSLTIAENLGSFSFNETFLPVDSPVSVQLGHFDNDAMTDIIVLNPSYALVYPQRLDGGYSIFSKYPVGGKPLDVAVADFDADGNLDFATSNGSDSSVTVYLNRVHPHVESTTPVAFSTDVAVDAEPIAKFDEELDPATVTDSSVVVFSRLAGILEGTRNYSAPDSRIIFDPDAHFFAGDLITTVLTNDITSLGGYPLPAGFSWVFETIADKQSGVFVRLDSLAEIPGPGTLAPGDFDKDGLVDIAVISVTPIDSAIEVLLNAGNLVFTSAGRWPVRRAPVDLQPADLDQDGYLDLVSVDRNSDSITVRYNDGTGLFPTGVTINVDGLRPVSAAVADLDNDGDLDIAVANQLSRSVSILTNTGGTTFALDTFEVPRAEDLVACDVNGDGYNDLVIANGASKNVSIHLNLGDATFTDDTLIAFTEEVSQVVCGDYDADNDVDLAVLQAVVGRVNTIENVGDGSFVITTSYTVGSGVTSLRSADVDGINGKDLVVTRTQPANDLLVLLNDGMGSFVEDTITHLTGSGPRDVALADLDGDMDIDAVTSDAGADSLSILRNVRAPAIVDFAPQPEEWGVAQDELITLEFNTSMDSASLATGMVVVHGAMSGYHPGDITYDSTSDLFSFAPSGLFLPGERVQVTRRFGMLSDELVPIPKASSWLFSGAVTVPGPPILDTTRVLDLAGGPKGIYIGDLDRDSAVDIAVSDAPNDSLTIFWNSPTDTFDLTSTFAAGTDPSAVVGGDLDTLNGIDLVVANESGNTLTILWNAGARALEPVQVTLPSAGTVSDVGLADLNLDGLLDILVTNADTDQLLVLLNNGDSTFSDSAYAAGSQPEAVSAADIDNDGDIDICVAHSADNSVHLLSNQGDGTFDSVWPTLVTGTTPLDIAAIDLDGADGPDIVTADFTDHAVSVFEGNGDGTFGPRQSYDVDPLQSLSFPQSMFIGDFTGDGSPDVITANNWVNAPRLSLLKNNGSGGFTSAAGYATSGDPTSLSGGDLDGDGDVDVVLANEEPDLVTIHWLQISSGCCGEYTGGLTGNVDDDVMGIVDLGDLLYLANAVFLGGPAVTCPAKGNTDGDASCVVDLGDILWMANAVFLGGPPNAACDPNCE